MPRKTKIFVGRLPENCRSDELRQLFVRFGEVTECDVMNHYGFVHMAREEDAATAIKALHNSNFKGATINVEQSTGKSRGGGPGGRRDDRRGPMRGGRGGGRDRPGPYNDRRGGGGGGGGGGGYQDYGNRGGGDYSGNRGGNDYGHGGGGYGNRGGYGQNMGGGYNSGQNMGGYGAGGYGASGGDYGRANDYGRYSDPSGRADYGNYQGMGGDYGRGAPGPADYGRTDGYGAGRAVDPYAQRNDYDRAAAAAAAVAAGPIRNGGGAAPAVAAYGTGGYGETSAPMARPLSAAVQNYNTGAPATYGAGPGAQTDMYSRRPAVPASGYSQPGTGYAAEGYDRADSYGPARGGGGRFPGPADAMPARY